MSPHSRVGVVEDGPDLEEVLELPEGPLHLLKLFVRADDLRRWEFRPREVGLKEELPIKIGLPLPDLGTDVENEPALFDLGIKIGGHAVVFEKLRDPVVKIMLGELCLVKTSLELSDFGLDLGVAPLTAFFLLPGNLGVVTLDVAERSLLGLLNEKAIET